MNGITKASDIPMIGPELVGHGLLMLTEGMPFGANTIQFVCNGHLYTAVVAHRPVIADDGGPTDRRLLEIKVFDEGAA